MTQNFSSLLRHCQTLVSQQHQSPMSRRQQEARRQTIQKRQLLVGDVLG
jgi:hypothetical protein